MGISNYAVVIGTIFSCFLSSVLYFYKEYDFKDNRYVLYAIFTITATLWIDKTEGLYLQNYLGAALTNIIEGLRFVFIFPAYIYLFITYILNEKLGITKKVLLFVPFLFFSILSIIFKYHNDVYVQSMEFNFNYLLWFEYTSLCAFISHLFFKLVSVIKHKKTQNTVKINRIWLKQLIIASYLLVFLFVCFNLYKLIFNFKAKWFLGSLKLLTSIYFFWLCFKGVSELRIKQERKEITQKLKSSTDNSTKAVFLSTKENEKESEYLSEINRLLKVEKLYREPDLSRERIAEKLGISPGYLSEIINSNYNRNFSSLINSYRIKEAIELLQNPEFLRYSIVSVAYEVGFNSKSAFYQAFKKETGTTPSVYLSTQTTQICPDL